MRTAILGATGLVGRAMLALLATRPWCEGPPRLLAGPRSAGSVLPFRGRSLPVRAAGGEDDFAGVDLALFSAGAAASRQHAPRAVAAGVQVIDNSSAYRLEPDAPLVVPEINGDLLARDGAARTTGRVIANPNCSTIQVALAVAPLARSFGLREVHVTTLQAVSGAGRRGVDALAEELARDPDPRGRLRDGDLEPPAGEQPLAGIFARPIAGNVVPQIGAALPDGSFEEEAKVERELRRILDLPGLAVTCTATRVPVWNGHSAAVRVVLARRVAPEQAAAVMASWPGLCVESSPHAYHTPAGVSGDCAVHVGRLRGDRSRGDSLLMWVVADNLLKGAALNAVQIADRLAGDAAARP